MMGVSPDLQPNTNFALIELMETKIIEIAMKNGYKGIFTTNTDPITQHFSREIFGYKTLVVKHINKFEYLNGQKPFVAAPDDQTVEIVYKKL